MSDRLKLKNHHWFRDMGKKNIPILAKITPNGVDHPWYQRWWENFKRVLLYIPRSGYVDSAKLFQHPDMFGMKLGSEGITPFVTTTYLPVPNVTVHVCSHPVPAVLDYLSPEYMSHDILAHIPGMAQWEHASTSAAIPWVMHNVAPMRHPDDTSQSNCKWYNYSGNCDNARLWEITSTGYRGSGVYAAVDGAPSANMGAVTLANHPFTFVIDVHKQSVAGTYEEVFAENSSSIRWAQWPFCIGAIYSTLKTATAHALTSGHEDRRALLESTYRDVELSDGSTMKMNFQVMQLDCADIRASRGIEAGWLDFQDHTKKITHDIFDEAYDRAYRMIEEMVLERDIDMDLLISEGVILGASGGGAFALEETAAAAAIFDYASLYLPADFLEREVQDRKIVNLLTGTSAGALTAIYYANLQDMWMATLEDQVVQED